jgi:hypothetical protein
MPVRYGSGSALSATSGGRAQHALACSYRHARTTASHGRVRPCVPYSYVRRAPGIRAQ